MFTQDLLNSLGLFATFALTIFTLWKSLRVAPKEIKSLDAELSQKYNDLANDAFDRAEKAIANEQEIVAKYKEITMLKEQAEAKVKETEEILAKYEAHISDLKTELIKHEREIEILKDRIVDHEKDLGILRKKLLAQDIEILQLKDTLVTNDKK